MDFWGLSWCYTCLEAVMVKNLSKHKLMIICLAAIVVAVVAFFKPECAENVARAFLLIITGV